MKAITIRNIPPRIARRISQRAAEDRSSLNKAVIRLLEDADRGPDLPAPDADGRYHDLDHLFGRWSPEEGARFDARLRAQRRIDRKLWK